MKRRTIFIVVLAIIALMALAEALFSNVGTLLNESNRLQLGTQFGLSDSQYMTRLLILAGLDGVAGIGTLMVLGGMLRANASWVRTGRWLALAGFLAYGVYQIVAALTILSADFKMPVIFAAIFYMVMGVIVYWIGGQREVS